MGESTNSGEGTERGGWRWRGIVKVSYKLVWKCRYGSNTCNAYMSIISFSVYRCLKSIRMEQAAESSSQMMTRNNQ